jgi:RNA recognition motif-containing protein
MGTYAPSRSRRYVISDSFVYIHSISPRTVNVYIPKDKITGTHSGFGFVEFKSEEDAEYAIKVMNMIKLYGKPIKVNKATQGSYYHFISPFSKSL